MIELDDATVQAALISKQILKRMPAEKVLGILQEKVFPFITPGETVKVDFNVRMCVENIEGTLEQA